MKFCYILFKIHVKKQTVGSILFANSCLHQMQLVFALNAKAKVIHLFVEVTEELMLRNAIC